MCLGFPGIIPVLPWNSILRLIYDRFAIYPPGFSPRAYLLLWRLRRGRPSYTSTSSLIFPRCSRSKSFAANKSAGAKPTWANLRNLAVRNHVYQIFCAKCLEIQYPKISRINCASRSTERSFTRRDWIEILNRYWRRETVNAT